LSLYFGTLGSSGIIYIDPSSLRRTTALPAVATATMATNQDSAVTMSTTSSQLARVFGVVIRQIADLLMMMQDYHALVPNLPRVLDISTTEVLDLQVIITG
jgi:E3 ubiquitin-protein ligase EDD1